MTEISIWKKIGIVFLAVVLLICALIDATWVFVKFFAPSVTVVNTFNFDTISTVTSGGDEDGGDEEIQEEYIIKVRYFSNSNGSGVEALEIQFNDFTDETRTTIYSQGIQFVANSSTDTFDWETFNLDSSTIVSDGSSWSFPLTWKYYYSEWGSYTPSNATISYYLSDDDFATTFSNSSTFADGAFTITLKDEDGEDELYRMSFAGAIYEDENSHTNSANYVTTKFKTSWGVWIYRNMSYYNYYWSYDIYAFAQNIYNMLQSTANGVHSAHILDLSNFFVFEKYTSSGKYEALTESEIDKVSTINTTYGGIYVEKLENGLKSANDSMFNAANNSAQYDNSSESEEDNSTTSDYFYGKTIVACDIYDFILVHITDNYYALKISDDFMNEYLSSANTILLSIQIDADVLSKNNIELYGFTKDSGLDSFTVLECYTYTTTNGEKIKTEVNYA